MDDNLIYITIGIVIVVNMFLILHIVSAKKKSQAAVALKQQAASVDSYEQKPVNEHTKTEVLGNKIEQKQPKQQPEPQVVQNDKTEVMAGIDNFTTQEKQAIKSNSSMKVEETMLLTEQKSEEPPLNEQFGLVVYQEKEQKIEFPLTKETTLIGRDPANCDLVLAEDNYVGRNHALIYKKGTKIYLTDLDSRNGTFVAGNQLKGQKEIKFNTKFKIGKTEMELRAVGG